MERTTGKNVFLLCNLYVSAMVGAGFATGQEIMRFFTCYGPAGFLGVLLSTAAFMLFGPMICQKAIRFAAYTPGELLAFRFGTKGETLMRIVNLCLEFSVLIVMLSGLRTLCNQMGIGNGTALVLLTAGVFFLISSDMQRVLQFNNIMTPLVMLGITLTCLLLLSQVSDWTGWQGGEVETPYPWFVSAMLYAGFNLLVAMPVVCLAGKTLQSEMAAVPGGVLGGLCVGGMAMLSQSLLFAKGAEVASLQMPVVDLAVSTVPWFGNVYQWVIFAAMATSAVICGRCCVDLMPTGKQEKIWPRALLVCGLAAPLSLLDFSGLIGMLYPFFGVIGILAVFLILW